MFSDAHILKDFKQDVGLNSISIVEQVPIDRIFAYYPFLSPIWQSYKELSLSSLSDEVVNLMTAGIQGLLKTDSLFGELHPSPYAFPASSQDFLIAYERGEIPLTDKCQAFVDKSLSYFWKTNIACFKYINPRFSDSRGIPLPYPSYFHDKLVLRSYDESSLEVRGNFFYPPSGFREWHTNYRNPGLRAYCVFCDESFPSSFNFLDASNGSTKTLPDKSDCCNLFEVPESSCDFPYLWHSVSSSTWRLSMGFRLVDQISDPSTLLSYISQRNSIYPFNGPREWEWWIRLPLWNSKSELADFLALIDSSQQLNLNLIKNRLIFFVDRLREEGLFLDSCCEQALISLIHLFTD